MVEETGSPHITLNTTVTKPTKQPAPPFSSFPPLAPRPPAPQLHFPKNIFTQFQPPPISFHIILSLLLSRYHEFKPF
jgi:hypothetical protein